jgi:YjbE family integral membrane protein
MGFDDPNFYLALLKIIWINILLSGDNAVVIAMACRGLPDNLRNKGIFLGAGAAIGLRILFTFLIVLLLDVPYLKIVGSLALIWIAVQLLAPHGDDVHSEKEATDNLWKAVGTVAVADVVMSLDNVIAIAAAAQGNWPLIIIGLLISIPLIIAGSTLVMALLTRFPILVWAGAGLLGWIAGEMLVTDPVILGYFGAAHAPAGASPAAIMEAGDHFVHDNFYYPAALVGAVLVLLVGGWYRQRKIAEGAHQRSAA